VTVRITLAPSVSRGTFEHLAHLSGWMLYSVIEQSAEHPYEQIWTTGGGSSAIHYIEDTRLVVAYLLTMGEQEAGIADDVVAALPTIGTQDAAGWAMAAAGDDDKARAAGYLATTAPAAADDASLAAFTRLLADPAPGVRRAAAFAASFPPWPELLDLIEPLAAQDPDRDVRATAAAILRGRRADVDKRE
jgi:roadblock/LC7 domain-containing protein